MTLVLVFSLSLSGASTAALSAWMESAADFTKGQMVNTKVVADGLTMDRIDEGVENWTKMSDGSPCPNSVGLLAYDNANRLLVLYLSSYYSHPSEMWTYDPSTREWTRPATTGNARPNPYFSAMAYDSCNGRTVLFNGETWAYNTSNSTWTNMSPSAHPPFTAYSSFSMTFDSAAGVMVVFGATSYSSSKAETWTYNMTNNTWTNMSPAASPCGQFYHGLAYDSVQDIIVSFGRWGDYPGMVETWTYNLNNNTWTNMSPVDSPTGRDQYTMTFDPSTSQVILYGGRRSSDNYGDTWTYNVAANAWTERFFPYGSSPSPRSGHSMAYDAASHLAVIWGGGASPPLNGEFWAYNASAVAWTNLTGLYGPSCRAHSLMAYDRAGGETVLFGGGNGYSGSSLSDTHTYNMSTNSWKDRKPSPSPPAGRSYAMAYDSDRGVSVLYCTRGDYSFYGEIWTYNTSANTWTNRNPSGGPSDIAECSMAYDRANKVMVLFTGPDNYPPQETWTYNMANNTWTRKQPATTPPNIHYHVMAYDTAAGEMVLFGYSRYPGTRQTWTYNVSTNTWTNKNPGSAPPGMWGWGMVYDSASDLVLLFGGAAGDTSSNESWTYNLTSNAWTRRETAVAPSCRTGPAMAYDEAEGQVVLFGGIEGDPLTVSALSDTWVYDPRGLQDSGTYTSAPFDTGGRAYYGTLDWNATVKPGTSVRMQLRTGPTKEALATTLFAGPDGTDRTFYESGGERINNTHNGSRWVQYRALFRSREVSASPVLTCVTLNYNLLHSANITSPSGGEVWTGIQTVKWSAVDGDHDTLLFDLYLVTMRKRTLLAGNLTGPPMEWSWDTASVPNGSYSLQLVARDTNPSIPLNASTGSRSFSIKHLIPSINNTLPHVTLLSPANGSYVRANTVNLLWHGIDADGDPLNYTVRYSDMPFTAGNIREQATASESFVLSDLVDNRTYYWSVDASDGKSNGTDIPTEIWSFTVKLPPGNIPVRISSTAPLTAWAGKEYVYNITSVDEDGDLPAYSIVTGPVNMTVNGTTGALRWTPTSSEKGDHNVTVMVSDGRGSNDWQAFTLTVLDNTTPPPPLEKPRCNIASPAHGARLRVQVLVRGNASRGSLPLVLVQVRVDGGNWSSAAGLEDWSAILNLSGLAPGTHVIQARAFDGSLYSEVSSVEILVPNGDGFVIAEPPLSIESPICWAVSFIVLVAAGACAWLLVRWKSRAKPSK